MEGKGSKSLYNPRLAKKLPCKAKRRVFSDVGWGVSKTIRVLLIQGEVFV